MYQVKAFAAVALLLCFPLYLWVSLPATERWRRLQEVTVVRSSEDDFKGEGTKAPVPNTSFVQDEIAKGLFHSAHNSSQSGASLAYVTSSPSSNVYQWGGTSRSAQDAFNDAFNPSDRDTAWTDLVFDENPETVWTPAALTEWVEEELLSNKWARPYLEAADQVQVPALGSADDQLAPGQYVGYSRRQLCIIVAKSLLGAGTNGYKNGLHRLLEKAVPGQGPARAGGFGRSFWILLATCAADPSLVNGGEGPMLLVAKALDSPDMSTVRDKSTQVPLSQAGLRVCSYDDGTSQLPRGLTPVPPDGCQQPGGLSVGRDFMTAEGLAAQATVDITAAWLGGYVFGNNDGLGGGQDERLMIYMPEVTALVFFLSQSDQFPQLRQPAWIIGARNIGMGLDGTCRFDAPLIVRTKVPLRSDLVEVALGTKSVTVSSSKPFLGFQSENQGFMSGEEATKRARRNKEPLQRLVDPTQDFAFEKQVRAWYRSVALTAYSSDIQPILQTLVRSIGTGPWLAGLWFGDSQLGFLSSWLGHAMAARTWGDILPLDYYIYSAFTENAANQCFVHPSTDCSACLQHCIDKPIPPTSFWLPEEAYMIQGDNPCIVAQPGDCGAHGLEDIVQAFQGSSASDLWTQIERVLSAAGTDTSRSVFDLLLS